MRRYSYVEALHLLLPPHIPSFSPFSSYLVLRGLLNKADFLGRAHEHAWSFFFGGGEREEESAFECRGFLFLSVVDVDKKKHCELFLTSLRRHPAAPVLVRRALLLAKGLGHLGRGGGLEDVALGHWNFPIGEKKFLTLPSAARCQKT